MLPEEFSDRGGSGTTAAVSQTSTEDQHFLGRSQDPNHCRFWHVGRHLLVEQAQIFTHPAQIRIRIGMASCSVCEANIRRRPNTLSKTRGKYSSMNEYPLKNTVQVFVHGRIPSQNDRASILPRTSTLSKTLGKYSSTYEYSLKNMGKYSYTDEYPLQKTGIIRKT